MRLTTRACVLALALLLVVPAVAAARNPILFVHGFSGGSWNWDTMIGRFKADGWRDSELWNWSYDWRQSNATTAAQIRDKVNQIRAATGAAKVDIVSHSMGGLSSRWYLKYLGGQWAVDHWVSLGGPNHGTNAAYLCGWWTSCQEMQYGSSLLNQLNAGDETPGPVKYGTFWSSCDEVINPDTSTVLSGAYNFNVGCVEHVWLLYSWPVYQRVRDFLRYY